MNIRIAIAALLCAFYLGDSHAEPMKVDGENCLIPDASYIHVGILNDRDRFFWTWCVTRFNRYWSMSLDPLDRTKDTTFSVGGTGSSDPAFTVHWPVIGWGEPATADLEAAALDLLETDRAREMRSRASVTRKGDGAGPLIARHALGGVDQHAAAY